MADRFGLKDSAFRKVEELSKGNQQKVQLIISILHNPQLLILTNRSPVSIRSIRFSLKTS